MKVKLRFFWRRFKCYFQVGPQYRAHAGKSDTFTSWKGSAWSKSVLGRAYGGKDRGIGCIGHTHHGLHGGR